MAEYADDLVVLISQGTGLGTPGTDLFTSTHAKIPTGDGPYTSVIEYGGSNPINMHQSRTTPGYEVPMAQVLVRAKTKAAAQAKARAVYAWLAKDPRTGRPRQNTSINGTYYVWLRCRQQPMDLGDDGAGRVKYGFNIGAMKRPAS